MHRPARSYLQRLHARSNAASQVRVVFIVVFALVAAPVWSALDTECGRCPRTCPMHQAHAGSHDEPASHLGCHRSTAAAAQHEPGTPGNHRLSVSCATCGRHAPLPSTAAPMILPPAPSPGFVLVVARTPVRSTAAHGRLADAPDTPPPIAAA